MNLEEFRLHFDGPKEGKYRCPVHDGYSLTIEAGKVTPVVVHCFGCDASYEEICKAAGIERPEGGYPDLIIKKGPRVERKSDFLALWQQASEDDGNHCEHPYLRAKDVPAYQLRMDDGVLLVPMTADGVRLVGIQRIWADGKKRPIPGSQQKNAYYYLWRNDEASHIWVAEGYATAATLVMSSPWHIPVVCAFTAGNLIEVCRRLKATTPDQDVYIAADHDRSGTGQATAQSALDEGVADYAALPPEIGDWNDYYVRHGLEQTKEEIYGY